MTRRLTTAALAVSLFVGAASAAAQPARPPAPASSASAPSTTPSSPPLHQTALRASLEAQLASLAAGLDGVMGYTIVDLTTGEQFGAKEAEVFPTASTIKLAILYELFMQADAKKIDLDRHIPFSEVPRTGGSGILKELKDPQLSLRDHAALMIWLSDNTSTNLLIDKLGMAAIQARIDALGLKQTKLRRRMMDAAAVARGDENVSTPREIASLLGVLYRGTGLSERSHADAIAMLSREKDTPMTRTLTARPPGTRIASKPGGLDGVRVDAGVVYLQGRPYVFVAMCTYVQDEAASERTIGEASRAAFNYFWRLGSGGSFGRRNP